MKRYVLKAAFVSACLFASVSTFAGLEEDKRVKGIAFMEPQGGNVYYLHCDGGTGFCYTLYTNGNMNIYLGSRILHCRPALQSPPPLLNANPNELDTYTMANTIMVELVPDQQVPSMQ